MFAFACFKCMPGCDKSDTMRAEEEKEMVEQVDMSDDSKLNQKITGYLEKKGKLKLMNSWKRYWFVLKGNLLLYYGSKEEYDALSPVKGRITLGPTCNVKPYPSTPEKFQITTRSGSVITLKADTTSEQNKWMKAIYSAVNENQNVDISPTKLNHFRYSTERLDAIMNNFEQRKRNQSPVPTDARISPTKTLHREDSNLLERLQRIGARSYCNSMSLSNHQMANYSPKPNKLTLELNERILKNEHTSKESDRTTPKKLQFSPEIPKIKEESRTEDKRVILEEEDYCVCSLEKNDNSKVPQATKKSRNTSSFESKFIFNQSPTSLRIKDKNEPDKPAKEDIQRPPREKLQILKEKILQSSKPAIPTKNIHLKQTDNRESAKANPSIKSENKESTYHHTKSGIKYNKTNLEDLNPQLDNPNTTAVPLGSPKILDPIENKTKENTDTHPEKPSSYQDFREDELYAKPQEDSSPKKESEEIFESTEQLYAEPESFKDTPTRRDKPDFEFPPPPSDAYESAIDLTSNSKYEDDDSLYEEADDIIDDDFIWQNEIYSSSVNRTQDTLYDEPNFQNELQHSLDKNEQKPSPEEFETDEALYEEVNRDFTFEKETKQPELTPSTENFETDQGLYEEVTEDFVFSRSPINGVNLSNELCAKPDTPEDCRSSSQMQFENDLYGKVDTKFKINHEKHRANEEKQIENDLYSQVSKHSIGKNQSYSPSNAEEDMEFLYTKPFKRTDRERLKSHNEARTSSAKEVNIQNDLYTKPNEELCHQNPSTDKKHPISTKGNLQIENDLYASPDELFRKEPTDDKHKMSTLNKEMQMENDLYAVPNEVFGKDSSQTKNNYESREMVATLSTEIQMENDLYAVPNEVFCKNSSRTNEFSDEMRVENDLYAVPNELFCKDSSENKKHDTIGIANNERQIENDLYAEPNINAYTESRRNVQNEQSQNDLYTEPNIVPPKIPKKPIFSRQNSRSDTDPMDNLSKSPESSFFKSNFLDKLLHKKPKQTNSTDEENSVDLENELYAQPNLNWGAQEDSASLYEEANLEDAGGPSENFEDNGNLYEDPDQLMLRPKMKKEHSMKKKKVPKSDAASQSSKAKDEKKHDSFIQRLLKQATKKHGEKGDKSVDLATRDESLALLTEIQILLEKKKKEIKQMVAESHKPNHRRILSDSNANLANNDQCGAPTLKKSISIDLNDDYALVLDHLDDKEAIYSEVELVNRHSRELKDLIEEILKRQMNS